MTVWEELVLTLQTENKILAELLELGKKKQEQINDAQSVALIAHEEEKILKKLEAVDQQRASLFDIVAPGQDLETWLTSLSEEDQEQMGPLILELARNLAELQSQNELNQELIAQSLSYVQFSLNLMVGDEQGPTYKRPGTSKTGNSIFDRKV